MTNDARLKRQLLGPWTGKGSLLIPVTGRQPHGESENIRSYVTYSELTGTTPTIEEYIEKVRSIGLKSVMASLSNLIQILHNDGVGNVDLQRRIQGRFLTREPLQKLRTLENWQDRAIFVPQQILFTMKMAILYSPDSEDPRPDPEFRDALVELLLMASDFLDKIALSDDIEELERVLLSHLVRNYLLNMTDQLRYMIPRASLLFRKLPCEPELRALSDFLDLPSLFREATGFELKDYIAFGLAILSWFRDQSELRGTYDPQRENINTETFFSKTLIDPDVTETLLKSLTHTHESARAAISARGGDPSRFSYDFLPFMEKPLYQVKDTVIVPVHLSFLEAKFTNGIYWTIHDHLREGKRLQFTRFFGNIFEVYALRSIQRAIPDDPSLVKRVYPAFTYPTKQGDRKTSDVVVMHHKSAIFMEATASRIRMERTALSGDLEAFKEDVNKIILAGAKQLTDRIRDFRDGLFAFDGITAKDVNTIYPVIVTVHSMPESTPFWNYIRDLLKDQGLLRANGVEPLQLIDVEELEILETILPQGISLLEILEQRGADPERRNIGLKNFLMAKYQDGANEYLWKELMEIGVQAKSILFG